MARRLIPAQIFSSAIVEQTTNKQKDKIPPKVASTRSTSNKKAQQRQSSDNSAISADTAAADSNPQPTDTTAAQIMAPSDTIQEGRATCPQNKFHWPALDVGLDWKTAQQEREATEATKAAKKIENEHKKAEKIECAHLRKSGIAHVACLEETREQRDREEDAHLNANGTRHTYLESHKVGEDWQTLSPHSEDQNGGPEESRLEFEASSSSESSPEEGKEEEGQGQGEEEEGKGSLELPAKKVRVNQHFYEVRLQACLTLSLALQKAKTNAERKCKKQVHLRGEIDAAKQTSPASDAVGNSVPRHPFVPPPMAAKPLYVLHCPVVLYSPVLTFGSLASFAPHALTTMRTSPSDAF